MSTTQALTTDIIKNRNIEMTFFFFLTVDAEFRTNDFVSFVYHSLQTSTLLLLLLPSPPPTPLPPQFFSPRSLVRKGKSERQSIRL